jgi:trehalose-6-phosphate synthase
MLKQRYAGMQIMVGRDKLDGIQACISTPTEPLNRLLTDEFHQGVRQKLQAFEMFLNKHPEFQEKVHITTC